MPWNGFESQSPALDEEVHDAVLTARLEQHQDDREDDQPYDDRGDQRDDPGDAPQPLSGGKAGLRPGPPALPRNRPERCAMLAMEVSTRGRYQPDLR